MRIVIAFVLVILVAIYVDNHGVPFINFTINF
jgi:hypothetical protein